METEQLQMILDMVGSAGEGAWPLALLYLGKGILILLLWLVFLSWGIKVTILPLIRVLTLEDELLKAAQVYNYFNRDEKAKLVKCVSDHYQDTEV